MAELQGLGLGDLPIVLEVNFVPDKHNVLLGLVRAELPELLDLGLETVQAVSLSNVKDGHCAVAATVVGGGQRFEFLLACRVPKVDAHKGILDLEGHALEVNAYCIGISVDELICHKPLNETRLAREARANDNDLVDMLVLLELVGVRNHSALTYIGVL